MNFTRKTCRLDTPNTDAAELCARLLPGTWLIEAGHEPPAWHDPAQLLSGNDGYLGAMALSLGSAAATHLSLGPALIDRLTQISPASGPLAGLALHELIVNAAIHGNLHVAAGRSERWQDLSERQTAIATALADPACAAGVVTIAIGWGDAGAEVVVADEGDGYDTAVAHTAHRGSGRGLRLARLVGQVNVLRGGRQTAITLPCPLATGNGPA